MIRAALSPVVAAGDLRARTDTWAVTTDTLVKAIYPTLPDGKQIRVLHVTHLITCHHLPTGRTVVFSKKKVNWYDSRKEELRLRRKAWHAPATPAPSDWRGATITRPEVIAEVARMGAGDLAAVIVAGCRR